MYLQIGQSNGRDYLVIVQGYRDPVTKKVRHKTVKSLGYLEDLKKQFSDPVSHFRAVAKQMTHEAALEKQGDNVRYRSGVTLPKGGTSRKNIGYAAISRLYHELGLHVFFSNHSRAFKARFNTNNIMKLLIYSRILFPASKKKTYEDRNVYFENTEFSLDDVYRCLTQVATFKDKLQRHLHRQIKDKYDRTTELVYYDVTNYYFEIDEEDKNRRLGVSKEHRPDPIIQMGLLLDTMGIPIMYDLFPGNTNDCGTLLPILDKVKKEYEIGRTIVVADKGINTADNVAYCLAKGDGYVYSQTVRRASKELKSYVLDPRGYKESEDGFRIKSRLYPREIAVSNARGGRTKVRIDEKQVIFYSPDYDRKAKRDRENAISKAKELVKDPSKYKRAISYGAAKYVKNLVFDHKKGEFVTSKAKPVFDEDRLCEEEKFDGYYAIVTSECEKSDKEIIEIYRGLWRIEEAFKVTKSDLEARPVYLSREDHIETHFLICFVALVLIRLLAYALDNRFSVSKIIESLGKTAGTQSGSNWYIFNHSDEVLEAIADTMDIKLDNQYMKLGEIKSLIGATKKAK